MYEGLWHHPDLVMEQRSAKPEAELGGVFSPLLQFPQLRVERGTAPTWQAAGEH